MFRPPNYKLQIQTYYQTMYVRNMNISLKKKKLIKQSKPNKITIKVEIKWQRLREEICKHKDNTAMCYRRGNRSLQRKTSLPPSKQLIIHQRMKLGYMNSKRPSKPNLPSVPKPSKFLAPTRLRRIFVFFSLPDSAIAHCINQYQLVLS